MSSLSLILGGAASGKSSFAEQLCKKTKLEPVYLATAQAFDDEMQGKIAKHVAQRGTGWTTIEAPIDLISPLAQRQISEVVLLDCITLWLSNLLLTEADIEFETDRLLNALAICKADVVVVSNEVGNGVVPDSALGRQFRNYQGRLNQRLAAQADNVVQVVAGLPRYLKGSLAE